MAQDISDEEREALESEHRVDQQYLRALFMVINSSRDSYLSDRDYLSSVVDQFDSSSPVLYAAASYFKGKLSDSAVSNDYDAVIKTVSDQIEW